MLESNKNETNKRAIFLIYRSNFSLKFGLLYSKCLTERLRLDNKGKVIHFKKL